MMKLETTNRRDWQGFTRILEVMSFVDELGDQAPENIRETVEGFCELPTNPGQTIPATQTETHPLSHYYVRVRTQGGAEGIYGAVDAEALPPLLNSKTVRNKNSLSHSIRSPSGIITASRD